MAVPAGSHRAGPRAGSWEGNKERESKPSTPLKGSIPRPCAWSRHGGLAVLNDPKQLCKVDLGYASQ